MSKTGTTYMSSSKPIVDQYMESDPRIGKALELAVMFGGIDGDHHKAWVIDQIVRVLVEDDYEQLVAEAREGEDGPHTYDWNEGIAP